MSPELQKSIAEMIQYVQQGAEFAKEQAPLYAQELLRYEAFKASVVFWLAAFFVVISILALICAITDFLVSAQPMTVTAV